MVKQRKLYQYFHRNGANPELIVFVCAAGYLEIVGNLLLRKIAVFSHFMQPLIPHRITYLANIIALMRLGLTKWHEMDHD